MSKSGWDYPWALWGLLLLIGVWPVRLSAAVSESSEPAASAEATSGIDAAIKTAQQEVRDPFAAISLDAEPAELLPGAAVDGEAQTPMPVLQGIGFGHQEGYAVMNGNIYFQGDVMGGIKLLEVRRREVDIIINGGKATIPLFPDDDVKKAKERAEKKVSAERAPGTQPSEDIVP